MAAGVQVERARWWPVTLVAAGLLFGSMIQPSSSRGGWDNPVPIVYAPAGLYPPCFEDESTNPRTLFLFSLISQNLADVPKYQLNPKFL
jgi:hypothetical protein